MTHETHPCMYCGTQILTHLRDCSSCYEVRSRFAKFIRAPVNLAFARSKAAPAKPYFMLFRDGNQWCAVNPDFVNLADSPAGFGNTATEAIDALSSND